MDIVPVLSREAVVDAIRMGVRRIKGAGFADDIDEATTLWPADEAAEPGLAFDSLDLLEVIVFLEDELGWRIPDEEVDAMECRTVGDLAGLVLRSVSDQP